MGALRLLFRAEFRRRWRSWLVLATLIAVVGGVALAAAAAGRRTDSAFPRFVSAYGFDAGVYAMRPMPKLARLPGSAPPSMSSGRSAVNRRVTAPARSTRRTSRSLSCHPGAGRSTS